MASSYLRLFRRKNVLLGLRVNLSKAGPSLSVGVRGAHVTFGRRGVTRTVGIPGTGVFYTSRSSHHTGSPHRAITGAATRRAGTQAAGATSRRPPHRR